MSERPTTLLHDGWGSPRPLTDAELARLRRMDRIHDWVLLGLCGVLVVTLAVFVVWVFNIPTWQ